MYLEIKKINSEIIKISQNYFGDIFCKNLKKEKPGTYNESLVARFLIEQNKNKYSSISHKKNLVFIGTNNSKIGVDIEIFKKRDENLLEKFSEEEHRNLGGKKLLQGAKDPYGKTWKNFYILWTAKESIIKYENLVLDNIEEIILINSENINLEINNIIFNKKLLLKFGDKNFEVYSGNKVDLYYSVV
ncbi:MAG: 4'-phosphopantetheinyl transferase superfamily protein [Candidatus Gracilibacteria bacterium]|nr:4'-phosphopantetheinyl transferase superfamily protein [Candidatus Gracilibacteria bacterium]